MTIAKILLTILFLHARIHSFSQSNIDSLFGKIDPQKWSASIEKRVSKLEDKIIAKSQKTLQRLQKQEEKIYRRMLATKDSLQARAALVDIESKYKTLQAKLENPVSAGAAKQYIPKLDTLTTALRFLDQNGITGNIKDALAKTESLQRKLQQAEEIKNFIRQRKQQLKEQLEKLGLTRQLKKFNKQAYYYATQLNEYKEILKDSKKREKKAIELLSKTKLFKDFMRKNSMLASLFRLPGNSNDPLSQAGLAGLQTRIQVNNLIQQTIAAGGPTASAQFTQNMQNAQSQINQLKNKITQSGGGSSDDIMPDGFKPNVARTKTFIQRIRVGTDFQTTRHNKYFPVNSDIGISASYMLNSNSHISLGTSFKVGWGTGFNHIRLSSQGASIRGGIDWRLKGNLFIAGSYEQNYFSEIRNIDQLRDYNSWKTSALLGLHKEYKAGKGRGGAITLLYDLFYNRPPVRTQPLTVRFGFNLK